MRACTAGEMQWGGYVLVYLGPQKIHDAAQHKLYSAQRLNMDIFGRFLFIIIM